MEKRNCTGHTFYGDRQLMATGLHDISITENGQIRISYDSDGRRLTYAGQLVPGALSRLQGPGQDSADMLLTNGGGGCSASGPKAGSISLGNSTSHRVSL